MCGFKASYFMLYVLYRNILSDSTVLFISMHMHVSCKHTCMHTHLHACCMYGTQMCTYKTYLHAQFSIISGMCVCACVCVRTHTYIYTHHRFFNLGQERKLTLPFMSKPQSLFH